MKAKQAVQAVVAVLAVFAAAGLFFGFIWASAPKKLAEPERWEQEGSVTGVVARVGVEGVEVELPNGKKTIFHGERGFTNGQSVRIKTTAHFVRHYQTVGGALEWYDRSLKPLESRR